MEEILQLRRQVSRARGEADRFCCQLCVRSSRR
jgi:hypothetical protein